MPVQRGAMDVEEGTQQQVDQMAQLKAGGSTTHRMTVNQRPRQLTLLMGREQGENVARGNRGGPVPNLHYTYSDAYIYYTSPFEMSIGTSA